MKIKLLIATTDSDYAEHLSSFISEKFKDTFDVSVCSSAGRLKEILTTSKFDMALLEPNITHVNNLNLIQLPLALIDESEDFLESSTSMKKIRKYQRISSIVGTILEYYSEVGKSVNSFIKNRAHITAVWSPAGGTGKTTVALACAANKVSSNRKTVYLNLENFSSTSAYFQENGKSISKVFEKLESNAEIFLMGIRQMDSGSGISYFCGPENYDDISILTANDIEALVNACVVEIDELVIDLSSQCDDKVQRIFELADTVLAVCDTSSTAQAKLRQFLTQHNVFGLIHDKTILVNNKGAKTGGTQVSRAIQLPLVQSADPISVYKTLSVGNFDW